MENEQILLGYGEFAIDSVPIGLTRGGGSFEVETEYREVEADGDRGPVKGRIVIDRKVGKLTVNALTAFSKEQYKKYYPALSESLGTIKDTFEISNTDYHTVTWTGKTMTGVPVVITLNNAINLENLSLTLEDKNEVVPELAFTAAYAPDARNTPPWEIKFGNEEE